MSRASRVVWVPVLLVATHANAATRTVGPGKTYDKPCAAFAAAADGDVIELDASGNYDGDVCAISRNGLTIRGVNGLAKIDAAGKNSQGKATWVVTGNDTTIENVQLTGSTVPSSNGAGIRQEGKNLTVRACVFRDNQDGILAGDNPDSHILIERTEFDHNGAGDGQSHNLYINHVGKLTFQFNWSHRALVGHLLKSRAAETYVLYNRLTGEDGTESYEIDVPNGGNTWIIGNLVQQSATSENPSLIGYQQEGANAANPGHSLFVVNNTFVNEKGPNATFVNVNASVSTKAVLQNNVFAGGGTVTNQAGAVLTKNFEGTPKFVNAQAFDYHLADGSPGIDTGAAPGDGAGFALTPAYEYVHPMSSSPRVVRGVAIDPGAYENGQGGTAPGTGGATAAGGAPNGGATGGTSSGGQSTAGAAGSGTAGATASGGGTSANGGNPSASGGNPSANGGRTGGAAGTTNGTGGTVTEPGDASASGAGADKDQGGCDCRFGARTPSGTQYALALAALVVGSLRRRRRAPAA